MDLLCGSKQGVLKAIEMVGGKRKFFGKKKNKGCFVGKPGPGAPKTFYGFCRRCHRRGHMVKDCKFNMSRIRCNGCNRIWHFTDECLSPAKGGQVAREYALEAALSTSHIEAQRKGKNIVLEGMVFIHDLSI